MKRLFSLVKVVAKQGYEDIFSAANIQKKKNSKIKIWQILLIIALFVYLGGLIFVPIYYITGIFYELGQVNLVISALLTVGPVVSLFFAILSTPGIFYFANDTTDLLALPLQPWEIVFARMVSAYIQTLIGSALIYIPVFISFFIIASPGPLFILSALVAYLIVPIIPLVLAYLITVLVMTFIPIVKNKDLYMYFTFALVIIPTFMVTFLLTGFLEDGDAVASLINSLISGDNTAYRYLNLFLPTSAMIVRWVIDYSILDLILATAITASLAVVIIGATQKMYFKGLLSVKESSSKKRKLYFHEKNNTKRTPIKTAILKYDLKRILRTPSFALSYLMPIIIIPVFTLAPIFLSDVSSLAEFAEVISDAAFEFNLLLSVFDTFTLVSIALGIGAGFGLFMGNLDSSSNTAISREGETMKEFLKMPIQLSEIVHAKARYSILINSMIPIITALVMWLLIKTPFILVISFLFSALLNVVLITYISLFVDVLFPNLNWTTEQQAAKGTFKSVLVVIPFMVIPILVIVASISLPPVVTIPIFLIVMPLLTYFLYMQTTKFANTRLVTKVQNS